MPNGELHAEPSSETALLGAILLDPVENGIFFDLLVKECFDDPENLLVYQTVKRMHESGEVIDAVTLHGKLKAETGDGRSVKIVELMEAVPSAAHAKHYAKLALEKAQRRLILTAANALKEDIADESKDTMEAIAGVEKAIEKLPQFGAHEDSVAFGEVLQESMDAVELAATKGVAGFPSGLIELDRLTGGYHRGELTLIAGRPSMGKTSLAMNSAVNMAKEGHPGAIFSLEVPRAQLGINLLSAESKVGAKALRSGQLTQSQRALNFKAVSLLSQLPLHIQDSLHLDVASLRTRLTRLVREHGVEFAVVDYIGLMDEPESSRHENREKEIGKISRGLKAIALQLNIAMIALAQLNRSPEKRDGNKPRLSDLRDSGTLEQDADTVVMLFRPSYYSKNDDDKAAEILVEKQRHGPTGMARATFLPDFVKFENYTEAHGYE